MVTGAAQGIGEQTARRISAEGGTLVLADRSELVKDLADELAAGGPRTLAVTADLEHYEGADSVVRQALSEFGRIDVLINNVGGAINFKPFTEFTDTEIRAELDRSLLTTLYACRAALPSMVERGEGVIVNVSSAATRGIHRIPYSAAKGGINAITASLALEYADAGIRVVATAPGGTEAPPRRISRGTPEPTTDTERGVVPGARRPDPRLVAAEAVRHARRTGRRDLLPGLRRGVLHHRHGAARRRRRSGLTQSPRARRRPLPLRIRRRLRRLLRSAAQRRTSCGDGARPDAFAVQRVRAR